MRPQPFNRLRDSWSVWRRHPIIASAVGFCVVVSMGAVCCGVGVFSAPWFAAELFALQLAWFAERTVTRKRTWIWAVVFLALVCLVVVSTGFLTITTWVSADASSEFLEWQDGPVGVGFVFGGVAIGVANLILLPYLFVAPILIDRGGRLGAALVDSARWVAEGGVLSFSFFGLVMALVYGAPVLAAMGLTLVAGDSTLLPWILAIMLPGLAVSIPLGQGMIASAYEQRRSSLLPADSERVGPQVPRRLTAISMGLLLLATLTLLILLSVLAFRAAPPAAASDTPRGEPLVILDATPDLQNAPIPESRLSLELSNHHVLIQTNDAGGVGQIPLGDRTRVERVVVWEEIYGYRIGIFDAEGRRDAFITGAGVRLDDGFDRRLTACVALWEIWLMLGTLLLGAWILAWAVLPLGELRHRMTLAPARQPSAAELEALTHASRWRVRVALGLVVMLSIVAEVIAFRAVGWL